MTQLEAQRVVSASLKHGDPAVLLKPGTRATLVWLRSYRDGPSIRHHGTLLLPRLKHEYEAYAHNSLGHFVRINVTTDMIQDVQFPTTE